MNKNNFNNTLFLMLTYECNLTCKYCLLEQKKKWMMLDTAKKAIDIFFEHFQEPKLIRLFGGEPLLNFNLVKDIIIYTRTKSENYKKKITFDITTNGTVLNDEILNFLENSNDIELVISLDGKKDTQIKNRIGSQKISSYNWFEPIKHRLINLPNVTVNKLISANNVDTLLDDFVYIYKTGFRKFNFLPAYFNDWQNEDIEKLQIKLKKLSIVIKHLIKTGKKIYIKNLDIISDIPLSNKTFFVDVDGNIYCSNLVATKVFEKHKKVLKIGNVENFEPDKMNCDFNLNTALKKHISKKLLDSTLKVDCELSTFVENIKNNFDKTNAINISSSFQNYALEKLLNVLNKNLPVGRIIYDGWKLEEIYPHRNFSISLSFTKQDINKRFVVNIGTSDKNENCFSHTNTFNLYLCFRESNLADGLIITLKHITGLLLKIPDLKLLIENHTKNDGNLSVSKNVRIVDNIRQQKDSREQKLYQLWISSPCDFDCIFCSIRNTEEMRRIGKEHLPILKKKIDKTKEDGVNLLQISGFEILNYDYILDILQYAKNTGYEEIRTYATGLKFQDKAFAKEFIDILGDKFMLYLPLYGHTSKLHDSITQTKGSFKKLLQGIDHLLSNCEAQNITINSVIVKQNYKEISSIRDFVKSLGISNFFSRFPYPSTESKNDRYTFVAVSFTNMLPFLISCSPPMFLDIDIIYPCIFFTYFQKYGIHSLPNAKEILPQIPFLFGTKVPFLFTTIEKKENLLARARYQEKNLTYYARGCTVTCPYVNECVLSTYCAKKIFRKYIQIFGDKEFHCITERMLTELKSKLNLAL